MGGASLMLHAVQVKSNPVQLMVLYTQIDTAEFSFCGAATQRGSWPPHS